MSTLYTVQSRSYFLSERKAGRVLTCVVCGHGTVEADTRAAERAASHSLRSLFQEGVEVRVARIFNTFGPRMHMNDGRVVSNFILQTLQGEPLTVCRPPWAKKIGNHQQVLTGS